MQVNELFTTCCAESRLAQQHLNLSFDDLHDINSYCTGYAIVLQHCCMQECHVYATYSDCLDL